MSYGKTQKLPLPLKLGGGEGGNNLPMILESNQNHARAENTEVCPCLPAAMGLGGGYVPMIVEPLIIREDITIKVDGGVLHSPWTQCTDSKP